MALTDVDPNAPPIKLAPQKGLDPNQHDPNKEGSFLERQVNKNTNKVLNVSSIADSVITAALTGSLGAGALVYGGYKLIQHLINRWDINVFKLFTDPFGFFGGSMFRSTRYFHYFTQYSQEQAEFLPDPINTYASVAVASNQDIGDYVIKSIQSGKGNNLKKYYRYSTSRFGNRNWDWRLDRVHDVNQSTLRITNHLLRATTTMPKRFEIVFQDTEYKEFGTSYLAWIQKTYGLDEFNKTYNGRTYEILQPPKKLLNGWGIAYSEVDDKYLSVPNLPIKPSKGITYWIAAEAPKNLEVQKDYAREFLKLKDLPKNYPNSKTDIGKLTWVQEKYYWTNPYSKKSDNTTDPNPENSTHSLNGGLLYSKFVTLVSINDSDPANVIYEYQVTMVVSYVGYDKEQFFFVENDGNTNNEDVAKLFIPSPPKSPLKPVLASNTSTIFKFYPYIPLREWTQGRHAKTHDLPIVPKEFTEAMEELNQLDSQPKEETESYVDKNKKKIDKHKHKSLNIVNKKGETAKSKQRKLQKGFQSKRKVKLAELINMKKPMNTTSMKRHINQMAKLLNIDFEYESANFTASQYYDNDIYKGGYYASHLLMPAVNFASNNKETHRYLYTFFNRIYNLYGKDQQVKNWYATVQNATSLQDISMNKLEWVNQSTMDYGGMSWLFINKFTMTGRIRKIRRNHRYFDVLRGKPVVINTLDDLQTIVEPLHELADDKFHKSKNGIEYCIGGEKFIGNGIYEDGNSINEVLKNFDYTFFAKQSGENEISVIAVAGLSFTTKLSEMSRWCRAFHDLELHYKRNYEKYIETKENPNTTDELERRESKKHTHYNVISHWGIIPLEYHTLCKLGGAELERFAQRSLLHYGFIKSEQKGKRKGLKPVLLAAQVTLFIVSVILALPSGGASLTLNAVFSAVFNALTVAVVTNLAVRYALIPLLKAIGIKGFVALIVVLAMALVATMSGGVPLNTQSVLPYAHEVGKQTATQVSTQLAKETTTQSVLQSLESAIALSISQAFSSTFQTLNTVFNTGFQAINKANQQEMQSLQSVMKREQEAFNMASKSLREQQEELQLYQPNFDVKEVLANLRLRFKMYNPDTFITSNSNPDTFSASYDYLTNFVDMKLNLDPETFDPVRSLDFSFNT